MVLLLLCDMGPARLAHSVHHVPRRCSILEGTEPKGAQNCRIRRKFRIWRHAILTLAHERSALFGYSGGQALAAADTSCFQDLFPFSSRQQNPDLHKDSSAGSWGWWCETVSPVKHKQTSSRKSLKTSKCCFPNIGSAHGSLPTFLLPSGLPTRIHGC